jgi:hypothetical protein
MMDIDQKHSVAHDAARIIDITDLYRDKAMPLEQVGLIEAYAKNILQTLASSPPTRPRSSACGRRAETPRGAAK